MPKVRKEFNNAYQLKDYYRDYVKRFHNKNISEGLYGRIFRAAMNDVIERYFMNYLRVCLPYGIGELFIYEPKKTIKKVNDRWVTNVPVNWDKTNKLWEEDDKFREKKHLIFSDTPSMKFTSFMRRWHANHNQEYFEFRACKSFKKRLINRLVLNKNFNI